MQSRHAHPSSASTMSSAVLRQASFAVRPPVPTRNAHSLTDAYFFWFWGTQARAASRQCAFSTSAVARKGVSSQGLARPVASPRERSEVLNVLRRAQTSSKTSTSSSSRRTRPPSRCVLAFRLHPLHPPSVIWLGLSGKRAFLIAPLPPSSTLLRPLHPPYF